MRFQKKSEYQLIDVEDRSVVARGDSLEEISEQLQLKTGDLDADWGELWDGD